MPSAPLVLYNDKVSYDVGPALSAADVELSVEGPSTQSLSWSDQSKTFLKESGLFDGNGDGKLDSNVRLADDDTIYRLAELSRGNSLQFSGTFEDEAIARLRSVTGIKRPQSSSGHVAFARSLCREAGVEMRSPQGVTLIPATNSKIKARVKQEDRDKTYSRGIGSTKGLTIKGSSKITDAQVRLAETALARAAYRKAGPKATLALMMALIVESEITNLDWSDGANRSRGPLQARPGISAGVGGKTVTSEQARDVEYMVDCFLLEPGFSSRGGAISLAKKHPGWSAGTIAWNVEMPAEEYRGRYDDVAAEARKWIAAYGGTEPSTDKKTTSTPSRGDNEDSWEALKRMAEERGYRVFAIQNVIYYGREQDFIRARPVMEVSDTDEGIEDITWEWVPGKKINTATVTCRTDRWVARPGSVVMLLNEGPASGRWLVARMSKSRFSTQTIIELRRGTALIKPSSAAGTSAVEPTDGAGGALDKLKNAYKGSPVPGMRPASASTHETGGLAGFPAFDFMASAGTPCVAPEAGKVTRLSGRDPKLGGPPGGPLGYSIYMLGASGTEYYMTHLDKVKVKVGQRVAQGAQIAQVANGPASWSTPHVHMGMKPWKNWNA